MWAQRATMPLVVEATLTSVSAAHGRARAGSAWPPQQSTTRAPSRYTHTDAPTSPRLRKLSKNASRTAVKAGSQWPSMVSIGSPASRVVAGRLAEAADLACQQRGEADRGEVLEVRADRLQPDRQPLARDPRRERGGGLSRHRGERGVDEPLHVGHRPPVDREGQREFAGVRRPGALDVRIGQHVDGGGQQHIPLAEKRAPRGPMLLALAVPEQIIARRALEPAGRAQRELVARAPERLRPPASGLLVDSRAGHRGEQGAV